VNGMLISPWETAAETSILIGLPHLRRPGPGCLDKSNEEAIRMVGALADVIAPRDHEFRVVAPLRE
jgi:hypothetical protein